MKNITFADLKIYFKSKAFKRNLLVALGTSLTLVFGIYFLLGWYTHHGEKIPTPKFTGLKLEQIEDFAEKNNMEYFISDSIYNPELPKGVVIDQKPDPGFLVKSGRTIYITLNSIAPPQIKMPKLVDVSYQQAEAMLQTYGLKIGNVSYKSDLAKNTVLEQSYEGKEIRPGTLIRKGSRIDLVISDGLGNTFVDVPQLIGLSFEEAKFVLAGSGLNVGSVILDESLRDTAMGVVWKQNPEVTEGFKMKQGETMDLWITMLKK